MPPTNGGHAVVLGASMAGLVTARVLAERFDRVTVVERDELPASVQHRRGVPQGRHIHALLACGCDDLDELFPGFVAEVVGAGAHLGDVQQHGRWYIGGFRYQQAHSGMRALAVSRPMLEAHVRDRVRALREVEFRQGYDVTGLVADAGAVTGVRVAARSGGDEPVLASDLVVDASGRGSRTPGWLEALGYARPGREEIRIGLGYTTRHYRLSKDALSGDLAIVVGANPATPRGGVIELQEHDVAIVTLIGYLGDHPPTDAGGFTEFAASLPVPDIHEAIRDAEPLDDPVSFKIPVGARTRYERLRRFPDGLLVLGDALCSLNPIYGQGMSVATEQALVLRDCLQRGTNHIAARFHRRAAHVVDRAWVPVVTADLQIPGVEGPRMPTPALINAYIPRVHAAAARDPRVARAFLRVSNLVDPPPRLLGPATAARVLRANLRRGSSNSAVTPAPAGTRTPSPRSVS